MKVFELIVKAAKLASAGLPMSMIELSKPAELASGEYADMRTDYRLEIESILSAYLNDKKASLRRYKNQYKRTVVEFFGKAFEQGFTDVGRVYGQDSIKDDDAWLNAKVAAEFGYINTLFIQMQNLKDLPAEEWENEPARRADGYAKALDGVYNEGKLRAALSTMLTFAGQDGEESCKTCRKWKGKRHSARFWIKRNLIPGQPGNHTFECGGYNCKHFLMDDKGNIFTV